MRAGCRMGRAGKWEVFDAAQAGKRSVVRGIDSEVRASRALIPIQRTANQHGAEFVPTKLHFDKEEFDLERSKCWAEENGYNVGGPTVDERQITYEISDPRVTRGAESPSIQVAPGISIRGSST